MRSKEANGQAKSLLGTSVSRTRWQMSHISYTLIGVITLTLFSGLNVGGSYVISKSGSVSELWPLVGASFAYSTATLALASLTIAIIAFLAQLAVAAAWAAFAGCMLLLQVGELLELPQWVMNLSLFGHLPAMPAQDFKLAPVVWLLGMATVFLASALVYFNRRDIVTS